MEISIKHNTQRYYIDNNHNKVEKHHRRETNKVSKENDNIGSGNVTSMIGKMSLTFNDVARALNFTHNKSLNYEIINNQLIIKKDDGNGAD
jgi:uncharacterized FlaG/YvyC family protein